MGVLDRIKNRENKEPDRRPFHFFETIANSVFIVIVGIFSTIFFATLGAAVLFFNPIYNQLVVFSFIGIVCFAISFKFFLASNIRFLRNLTYENLIVSRRKLFSWTLHTFNLYFLLVWFALIILGSTNGFNISFPTDDSQLAFISTDAYTTKILGFVLLCVHLFLMILAKLVVYYWSRILSFAGREFEKRRRALEEMRSKVGKS